MKPILKYPGSKRKLATAIGNVIEEHADLQYARLWVPFAGSASVPLHLEAPNVILNDAQRPLITTYFQVTTNCAYVVDRYRKMAECFNAFNDEDRKTMYYRVRDFINSEGSQYSPDFAASYLFLNRAGFNGLVRYNKKGEFNVPMGRYKHIPTEIPNIVQVAVLLSGWTIKQGDFDIMLVAMEGDIVYCDPPFIGAFDQYTPDRFTDDDHKRLANNMRALANRGVTVITSNTLCEKTEEIYNGFEFITVDTSYSINSDGSNRGKKQEYLIVNR